MGESRESVRRGETPPERRGPVSRFLFPRIDARYLLRLLTVAALAFLFFRFVCIPLRIRGGSMEPTYRDGGVNLGFLWSYAGREPRRYDVVMVRLAGRRVMYLKRVVAFPGEEVAFVEGRLLVDGEPLEEPYVERPCHWNLEPLRVDEGHVYVVGDNRSMPADNHVFGQIARERVAGRPLW